MCDCKKNIEAKLLEECSKRPGTNHKVEITGYGVMLEGNVMKLRPVMPVEHTFDHTFLNGNVKRKKKVISFALSRCPFCGEMVDGAREDVKEENNPAVAAIQFALDTNDGIRFLELWNYGEFDIIRKEWPDCPKECFIGAEVGYEGG